MNRDELHELVTLLKDQIASGQFRIGDATGLRAALAAVRLDSDGRVDPNTVDGRVRAAVLAVAAAQQTREMRKISLRDVQSHYFEILDQFFGQPFSEMKAHDVSPVQIADHLASQDGIVRAFETDLQEFASGIHEFWDYYGPIVDLHLSGLKGLKSVFGGDIFPSYTANIACSVGLYMDTVVLPDPLLRILGLAKIMTPREVIRLVTKHALSALGYRELALADVDPPIVVITGDPIFLEPSYRTALQVTSEADVVKHASAMFGRKFLTLEELKSFLSKLLTADELVAKMVDPKRLLFDSEWSEPFPEQFARYGKDFGPHAQRIVGSSVADIAYGALFGRMMQSNDLLLRSARYAGTPLIDAPTSWQYLLWKYEYDADRPGTSEKKVREAVISKAIASEGSTEFGMLSGVPARAIIELRRNGALLSLRETIRTGLNDIDLSSPDSLSTVADEVIANIDRSFEAHDKELRNITSSRRKFFGLDVSRWIASGGVSLAAALAHNVGLAVLAAVAPSIVGTPSIPDLQKRWQDLQSQSKKLKRSPAAILFRHLGHKFGFPSAANKSS